MIKTYEDDNIFCARMISDRAQSAEARSNPEDPNTQLTGAWYELLETGAPASSGVRVNEITAMNLSSVWAAINVIANAIAVLPFRVLRAIKGGFEEARTHPAYSLLSIQPSPDTTAVAFISSVLAHALWGNGYARIIWDGAGRPKELLLLQSGNVRPFRKNGRKYYDVNGEIFEAAEILHVPGLGFDGLKGKSVITIARESMGLSLAAERFGAKFFGNDAKMAGVLEIPRAMQSRERVEMGQEFDRMYRGGTTQTSTVVLANGAKYNRVGLSPEDSQFLGTRVFQVSEVARWFQLPPHKIGDLSHATFSNIESQDVSFLTGSLMHWIVRLEQEFTIKLIGAGRDLICDFDERSMRRGDMASRNVHYQVGRQNGFLSVNDVRADLGMNAVDNGDGFLQPLNMVPLGTQPAPPSPPTPPADPNRSLSFEVVEPVIRDALGRMARKESKVRSAHDGAKLTQKLAQHRQDLWESIRPGLVLISSESRAEEIVEAIMVAHAATFSTNIDLQVETDLSLLKAVIQ